MYHSSSCYSSYINNNDPNFFDANMVPSSLPSNNYFMHRSSSTHSFALHNNAGGFTDPTPNPFFSSSSPSSTRDLLEFHFDPVRRVFSTGDLQASTKNCIQEGAAMAGQVGRYTAEERMKRLERYRSKRNQRNFHKKITYACRKTLADSRPRVRGRFARNGETETEQEASENSYESYSNHNNHNITSESYTNYNCGSNYNNHELNYIGYKNYDNGGGNDTGEWWRQMQAPATTVEDEECRYNDDMWANNFDSFFSMNLLS